MLGIIGHNGAGKSTLLKLLSRITTPTSGKIRVEGKIAPLIEVGAGLVGDMTGRENVYLNAAILGMSKAEVRKKFDEIVAFAELEAFIDTPIKRYSSGMQVKLGFSIATAVDADILIVDEVLAVGDLAFQRKCLDRMELFQSDPSKSILVVGHNIRQLERICDRMIVLDRGRIIVDDLPAGASRKFYENTTNHGERTRILLEKEISATGSHEIIFHGAKIANCAPLDEHCELSKVEIGSPVVIEFDIEVLQEIRDAEIIVGFHNPEMIFLSKNSSLTSSGRLTLPRGSSRLSVTTSKMNLSQGPYGIGLSIFDRARRFVWGATDVLWFSVVASDQLHTALPQGTLTYMDASWQVL
jgi:lipopolysaccharide transport system ATP-binding protein